MDFSHFAAATPEWLEYVRLHPPPASVRPHIAPDDKESLTKVRHAANADRSKWSDEKILEHGLVGKL